MLRTMISLSLSLSLRTEFRFICMLQTKNITNNQFIPDYSLDPGLKLLESVSSEKTSWMGIFTSIIKLLLITCISPCNSSHLPNSCRWKVGMILYRSKIYSSSSMVVSTGSPLIQSMASLFHPKTSQNRWGGYFRATLRALLLDCHLVVCTRSMLV